MVNSGCELQPACAEEGSWPRRSGDVDELQGTSPEVAGGSAAHDGDQNGLATSAELCKGY